ncbi:hypothetical protein ACA910_011314 [Epithemia clementina (nom. ined.)]
MATAGRNDWRSSRPPHAYSNSYDSYYGSPDVPPPSHPGAFYGSPRGGGNGLPPPPLHASHPQHSPLVSRSDSDIFYSDIPHSRSMTPTHGGPPPTHFSHGSYPYERSHPAVATTPYRNGRPTPTHRSQIIHRGTPPYSSRGASIAAAGTPRAHPPAPRPYADSRPGFYPPDSPYAGSRALPPGPPRSSRFSMPLHRQHLPPISRNVGPAPWDPPSPHLETQKHQKEIQPEEEDEEEPEFSRTLSREDHDESTDDHGGEGEEKGGDPLALLAKVSSDMETKPGQKTKKGSGAQHASSVPPTSPLRRTTRTSPVITPTTDNTSSSKRKSEVQVHPSFPEVPPPPRSAPPAAKGPKAVTPMPPYYPPYGDDPRGPPSYHYSGPPPSRNGQPYPPYPPASHRGGPIPPPSWQRGDPEFGPPHPAVVERHSFDSHESGVSHDSNSLHPPRRYFGQPPPPRPGLYGPPQQDWPRSPPTGPPMSRPPPGQPFPSRYMYGGPPPPQPPRPGDPYHHTAPYSYVQQPHIDEKTILRRKFSWKHYPELERFLIANRDDYLEHSSKNYTAEQKQYNNWLTEQLLAVAERHNYTFDPEDFNFVAIRDRIRCYYKSYVQTARKRGLELPGKAHIKKHRPANSLDKYAEEKNKKLLEEQRQQQGGEVNSTDRDKDENCLSAKQTGEGASAESNSPEKQ